MRVFGGIVLMLIALFCGGCSLLFAINDLGGQGLGVGIIWGPGLLIGGFAGWGAFRMLSAPKSGQPAPEEGADPKGAAPPKSDKW